MKILVTGGNGQLGRAFQSVAAEYKEHQIFAYDIAEMDVISQRSVFETMADIQPHVVVHAAAYTQVDKAETDVDNAYKVNVIGTQNIAAACLKYDAKMVYVSTDYVFDGTKQDVYTEFDEVNPINIYGKTKLEGEKIAFQICPKLFIARTAWLYGEGNNFVKTMIRLSQEREYISVVNDQTGTPTYAVDLAKAILSIADTESYGTYHMTNSGKCTWYEFAREIFTLMKTDIDLRPITTADYPTPAARPMHSPLRNYMLELTIGDLFRPWNEALADYLSTHQSKV